MVVILTCCVLVSSYLCQEQKSLLSTQSARTIGTFIPAFSRWIETSCYWLRSRRTGNSVTPAQLAQQVKLQSFKIMFPFILPLCKISGLEEIHLISLFRLFKSCCHCFNNTLTAVGCSCNCIYFCLLASNNIFYHAFFCCFIDSFCFCMVF